MINAVVANNLSVFIGISLVNRDL